MNVLDADDLDRCTILWATVAYTVANLDERLPRVGTLSGGSGGSVMWSHYWLSMLLFTVGITSLHMLR